MNGKEKKIPEAKVCIVSASRDGLEGNADEEEWSLRLEEKRQNERRGDEGKGMGEGGGKERGGEEIPG